MGEGIAPRLSFPSCRKRDQKDPILPFLGKSARDKRLQVILTSATTSPYTSSGGPKLPRGGVRGGGPARFSGSLSHTAAPWRPRGLQAAGVQPRGARKPQPGGGPRPPPARCPRIESCAVLSAPPNLLTPVTPPCPPTLSWRLHTVSGAPAPPRGGTHRPVRP